MKPERALTIPGPATSQPSLSRSEVEKLLEREGDPDSPVLSVYLDTDQSEASNLNRGFEVVFKNMLRDLEGRETKDKQSKLKDDAAVVQRFLKNHRDVRRSLVVFCDASKGFFWTCELAVKVRNILCWQEKPFVRPLLELMDEHERYGVVLTDRGKARMFTIFLGEVEELKEAFGQADVKHIKTSGTDHLRSQMHFQRKADQHALWHLKEVSKTLSTLTLKGGLDRLILGGPVEAVNELFELLPKPMRLRVVSKVCLPVEASTEQVLVETMKIEAEVERQREANLVELLITAANKNQKAVVGLDQTLVALQEGRLWQIVFADGFSATGGQCMNCQALLPKDDGPCAYCGKLVSTVADLIQIAIERVAELGGKIEQVRDRAAERLNEVGSVGAVLHY